MFLSRSVDILGTTRKRGEAGKGERKTGEDACVHRREESTSHTRCRGGRRRRKRARRPARTQYRGSINLNKVNFCRKASEYGNFVFPPARQPTGAGIVPRIQIKYILYDVSLAELSLGHAYAPLLAPRSSSAFSASSRSAVQPATPLSIHSSIFPRFAKNIAKKFCYLLLGVVPTVSSFVAILSTK